MKSFVTLALTTLFCLVMSTTGVWAQCSSADPTTEGIVPSFTSGNNTRVCLRFDPPASGNLALDGFGNTININIYDTDDCGEAFSWSVPDNIVIETIIAKGSNGFNTYSYDGSGLTSDGDLHSPVNSSGFYADLSHIDVCFHYKISVSKTAVTSFTRKYLWDISKSCLDGDALTLSEGQVYNYKFQWTASSTDYNDSNFKVSGNITINNQTPYSITFSVSDILEDGTIASVNCPTTSLAPGRGVVCTYTASPGAGDDGVNTVEVTTNNPKVEGNTATADYDFGYPTTELDKCISVSDICVAGSTKVCLSQSPYTSSVYTCAIGPYACGTETTYTNKVSFSAPSGATGSAECSVDVSVPECGEGCTLTQGYWKTHSSRGPARPADDTWNAVGGPGAIFYRSGRTWYQVFWTPPAGNPYYNLAHQFMAARLNVANGASTTAEVDACLTFANTFFSNNTPSTRLSNTVRAQVIACAGTLGSYNEGSIGPGHCDEEGGSSGNAIAISTPFEVKTDLDEQRLKLSPNPAQEQVRINLKQFIGMDVEIILSDRLGRVLYRQQLNQLETTTFDLQLSQLAIPSGMYQISVRSSELLLSEPLVIQGQR
jgi:archaellum component FlaF (FlaF/FlaG flagellin family)